MSKGPLPWRFVLALAFLTLPAAGMAQAQSDPIAAFYKGKTVTILVGYEAGGGYDIYARLIAQFLGKHIPVDEDVFARASDIVVNDWEGVVANRQIELLHPIEKGLVKRERVHELRDIVSGKVKVRQSAGEILYYKNNTGLAIQFAACGAILYKKLLAEGTNRTIPRDWFASQKYSIPPTG